MKTRVNYEYVPLPAEVLGKKPALELLAEAAKRGRRKIEAEHPQVVLDAFDTGVIQRTDIDKFLKVRYCEYLRLAVAERDKDEKTMFVTADPDLIKERDELVALVGHPMTTPQELLENLG